MVAHLALGPTPHGALGPWDEILTLLPVVIGTALLAYLYFTARKAPPAGDEAETAPPGEAPGEDPRPDG